MAVLLAAPLFGQRDSETRLLFDKATEAFKAGLAAPEADRAAHFRTAAAAYETLINDKGLRSGPLYYNAANCYMHLDELGKAILNYRRAETLTPANRELQSNLSVALARRKDHIAPREHVVLGLPVGTIGSDVRGWLVRLPAKPVVLVVAFTLVWVMLGLRLVRRHALLNVMLVLAVISAVVYGAAVAAHGDAASGREHGVLIVKEFAPRTGPSDMHPESFEQPLHEGVEFRILARESGWLKTKLPDGATCWLPAEAVGRY
jgi:tetratricopeptide (TPR) repeat protein